MSTPRKVTDLEEFVQVHIYRPYSTMLDDSIYPRDLAHAVEYLDRLPEWRKCVMDRIVAIKFRFPKYIVHPLVDMIRKED